MFNLIQLVPLESVVAYIKFIRWSAQNKRCISTTDHDFIRLHQPT